MIKILGIDPGRSKTGLALTEADGKILNLHIAATAAIAEELRAFVGEEPLAMIIMGNGTNSKTIAKVVQQLYPLTKLHLGKRRRDIYILNRKKARKRGGGGGSGVWVPALPLICKGEKARGPGGPKKNNKGWGKSYVLVWCRLHSFFYKRGESCYK